jgi:hypothetical protein
VHLPSVMFKQVGGGSVKNREIGGSEALTAPASLPRGERCPKDGVRGVPTAAFLQTDSTDLLRVRTG